LSAGALPQTHWGAYIALRDPLAGLGVGPTGNGKEGGEGKRREGGEGTGKGRGGRPGMPKSRVGKPIQAPNHHMKLFSALHIYSNK